VAQTWFSILLVHVFYTWLLLELTCFLSFEMSTVLINIISVVNYQSIELIFVCNQQEPKHSHKLTPHQGVPKCLSVSHYGGSWSTFRYLHHSFFFLCNSI
jgi:hypothetical protein